LRARRPAVLCPIGRLHVTAKIGAVDLDFARNGFVLLFVGKRFADFVSQNESRLVLAIKIA
jgi:hypothetical protein